MSACLLVLVPVPPLDWVEAWALPSGVISRL